jgi:hypothetical protein
MIAKDGKVHVPESITSDCSRSVDGDLRAFLAKAPDGVTVLFPRLACYGQDRTIALEDRKNLTIDGNGSTFQKRVGSDRSRPNNANWRIAGGTGVTLKNMVIKGSYAAPPRGSPGQGQFTDHGVSIWGATDASVLDVEVLNVDGECLTADPDVRKGTDYRLVPPNRNVVVDRLRCSHAGRQGVAATAADGFTLSNSTIDDTQQTGIDIEIDADGEILRNIKLLNNTLGATYFSAISVPAGNAPDVGEIVIEGNRMIRPTETCLPAFNIGASPWRLGRVTVTGNTIMTIGDGIYVYGAQSGDVAGNEIRKTDPGNVCYSYSGSVSPPHPLPVRVVDSPVKVGENTVQGFLG